MWYEDSHTLTNPPRDTGRGEKVGALYSTLSFISRRQGGILSISLSCVTEYLALLVVQ